MVSLMNGLSAMGGAISSYAGTAGLEQQKANLAQQGMVLADQLATTREHVGRVEAGDIAATAAQKAEDAAMARLQVQTESAANVANISGGYQVQATLGAANIAATQSGKNVAAEIGAQRDATALAVKTNAPLFAAQVESATAQGGMAADQQALAHRVLGLTSNIATEMSKPPDQQNKDLLAQWTSERFAIQTTPDTNAKLATEVGRTVDATRQLVSSDNNDIQRLLTRQTDPIVTGDPASLASVNAELATVRAQRAEHVGQLESALALSRAYTMKPGDTAKPPPASGTAPTQFYTPPAGKPAVGTQPAANPAAKPVAAWTPTGDLISPAGQSNDLTQPTSTPPTPQERAAFLRDLAARQQGGTPGRPIGLNQ